MCEFMSNASFSANFFRSNQCDYWLRKLITKNYVFRVFQILRRSATILSNGTGEVDVRNLDNQDYVLSDETIGTVIDTQLCACVSCHTACTTGHQRNKCSISSMLALQRRQMGSICSPRFNRVSRVGRNAWQSYHRNTFSLGIISRCQIQLNSQEGAFIISR